MPQKSMLVISGELLKKIDAHRGDSSRAKFINNLIDAALGEVGREKLRSVLAKETECRTPKAEENYITQREFEEFRGGIKALQRAFIDFLITYDMELVASKPAASRERPQATCVTRDELQEFNHEVSHILRVSLDFLVTFNLGLGMTEPTCNDYRRGGIEEYRLDLSPSVELEKPDRLTANFPQAYCLKCRRMVEVQNPSTVVLKNKTLALTGLCPISGTPVFRFLKQHTTAV